MSDENLNTTRPIQDLHIEITEDSNGILKVRPSSVSSSYYDDESHLSQSHEDIYRLDNIDNNLRASVGDVSEGLSEKLEEDDIENGNELEYVVIDFLPDAAKKKVKQSQISGPILILRKQNSRHFPHEATVTSSVVIFLCKKRTRKSSRHIDLWRRHCSAVVIHLLRRCRIIICATAYWYYICPFSIIIVFGMHSRRILVTEYEMGHRSISEKAEDSYRIFVDRNQSRSSINDDDEKIRSKFNYPGSEDGYEISFIDENQKIIRTLSLSSDFTRSCEGKSRSLLSIDDTAYCDTSSEYSFGQHDGSRDNVFDDMEKSIEYSIEFVEEDARRTSKKKKRPSQIGRKKKYKRKLITTSITHEEFDGDVLSKSYDETNLRQAKSVEILFTNEDKPDKKSKLILSDDFSKSCEELYLCHKPISVDIDIESEPELKTMDYHIEQSYMDQNGENRRASTPKKNKRERNGKPKELERVWEIEASPQKRQVKQILSVQNISQFETKDDIEAPDEIEELCTIFENNNNKPKYEIIGIRDEKIKKPKEQTFGTRFKKLFRKSSKTAALADSKEMPPLEHETYQIASVFVNPIISHDKLEEEFDVVTEGGNVTSNLRPAALPTLEKEEIEEAVKCVQVENEAPFDFNIEKDEISTELEMNEVTENAKKEDEDPHDNHLKESKEEEFFERESRKVYRQTHSAKKEEGEDNNQEELKKIVFKDSDQTQFTICSIEDENIPKGGRESIPKRVTKSFSKFFRRPSKDNEIRHWEKQPEDENVFHQIQPLNLEPIPTQHDEDEIEEHKSIPTMSITIDNLPTNEEVVSESIDVAVVESVDYNLDFVDEDDDEVEEDNDGEVEKEEQPAAISEEDGKEVDSLGKETEEEDTEIVPKRTVFRETLLNKKDDDEADDDELKDFREEGVAPNFILQNVDDEQISKGFVRSIPGKVKGSFRKLFTRSSSPNDDLKNEDESLIEEDSLHSVEPLRLEPIDTHHEEDEVPGEYQSFPTVTITIDNPPTNEEVVSESIDVAVVESVDYNLDFVDEDDDEVAEDNDGEVEDEEQPAAISEEDGREDDSLGKETDEEDIEIVPKRTVFRETLLNKKDDDEADDDELKDFREEGVAPNFILQNVDDEQISKGFVRSIPGKVKGSFRKLFTRSSSPNDDLKNEDESLIEEDSLNSVEPLRLEPIDTHHEEDEVPGEYQSFPTVTITIDNLPTNEEVVSESIDVAVVESVDYNLDFVDEDDDEVEEDNDGEVENEEQPAAISEEDGKEVDSLGKETEEEDTEIIPKRTVFRETLLNKKDDDQADDDELKDFREEGVAPKFIVQNVDDEQISKGFVRSIPGKVKGSFRKLFIRSSSSNDDLKNEDESLIEEDSLHSVEPLRLEPIDTHHEEDEVPGEYQSFPTVTITIDNPPTNEEVVSESIDVAVVESVDYNLDFVDEDDDEVAEDNDGEVEDEEQPAAISEEDGREDDSLGKETDEEDIEIVPKRTVFRETLLNKKDDDEADDDELKDFREEGVAPNFIVQNVDDEQISKGFVRSIPGKVKGSFRKLFTRSSSSNDDLKNEDESSIEEDNLHSVEPLRLEPIDTHHEEDEVPGEYRSFPTVTITIDNLPTNEEVVLESIDIAVVESVDYNLDFVDEDDDEVEEAIVGDVEDEEQPAAISEEDGKEDDSLGKETDEEDTEIVPKRTVFRETLLHKKGDDEADNDELKDFREEGVAPNFILQNVDDEQISKGFVRSIPGKVKGSFRKLFTRRSSPNDDLKNEDESLIEEDSLHSVEPLRLEPIDTHHEEDEVPGEYQSFPTVTMTIDNLPTNEEVVSESIDVAVVESVDYNLDFVDEDDDEVEEDNVGEVEDEEQPAAINEEDGREDDSLGKETDEEDTEIVPKRTVFRETLLHKKGDDEADDDELKDFREEGVAPNFIVQNVDDEQISKGFVRSIPGKVKGSFRILFTRSSSSNDDLKNEDESLIEEDSLHSVEPLRLKPIDTHHEEDEVPGEYQSFPTVTITIDNPPTNEEVVSESIDVAVVESVDYKLDFVDEDDDEVEEDNDGGVEDEEQPAAINEEDGKEEDSLGKETEEEETEIVPKRTVFRETLLNMKDDDEADDDELKDFREEGVAPNFILEKVDDEQISKGFVRSIPGKVKGSFRKLFTRSSSSNDDLKNEDESLIEEDSLHSVEPLRLEPIDTHHEEDEVPGEYQSFPTVTITIDNLPTNEEVVSESIDVAVVESVDYNLDFVDEDDDEVEEDNVGEVEDEEQPAAISEEDGREDNSLGKETDEEDTEIVPKRTVFRETLLNKKDDDEADDDELKDFREEGVAPNFILEKVDDEQISKGFVRSIPGKVKGSFRKLFTRSSSSNDDLKNEDESLIEEDSLHSVEPLRLEPIDTHHEEDEVPGEYQSFPTVTITIDNLPTNEEVVSESIDVAVVESVDYNLDFVDEDDDEVEEDNDGEVEDEEQPAAISEEDGEEDDSLGKETDEEDTEIVPKRTVFRETLLNKKDDDEADDDELKDFREEGVAPNFIVQNVDDEQISKGFVRSIPGKVKGSFRKLFTRSSSSNDDLKNEDESLIEEDSLHSVEPLRLEPIDTHHEEDEVPGEYQSFPTVTITIDNLPTNEEVVSELIDVAVVESVDYNLDFVDEDDDEVEEDNDGEVEDEEQPAAISEDDGKEVDSLGKETEEEDTEIVPKRTVFRETLLNKKDDDEADVDELKDFREEGVAPNFIVQNVDDEQISKGFVRSIPGKVKGSFRKLFTRSSSSNDDLKNEDESLIEEDNLHSVEPLRLEPIDTHHEEDEVPGEYQSFPTVTITIDNLPTNEEVVSESIDVAVVESVDYNLDFVDEDDDEVEEDNDGEIEDEEQPAAISEEDGREGDSLGKETDEEDTEIVPKRTVFRETLLNQKDDDEADDDELKDFREEGVAPNFIVQNVDDEQVSKGFVRSIPGKVKGSFRKLFTRSSSSNDDLKNEDESLIEEDSLHSVEPLRLEPIDTHHEEDEVPGEYQSFPTVTITIDNLPTNEEVVSESIDVAVVESVDYNLDFVDEDDDEVEEDNDGEVEDEEQPAAISEEDGEEDDSLGKETDEEDTEIVPKRTVFRETLLNKKDDDEADDDELKDFREEGVAPNFILQNVDDEQISKGFVRSIPGKVKGSFRKLFTRSSSSNDDLKNEDESLIEEDSLHSVEPLRLEPIDTHHEEDEVPGEYQSFPTVTITIDNPPTNEEVVSESIDVAVVDDEQVSKGFVRSIPGKVKGSFRKLFTRSSSSNDDLKNEDESLIEEDSLHSVEPLRLEPIDTHHEEDEVPGEYQSFPTVTITIDNLPTNEEVVSESIDVAVVESVEYNLDFVDEDDDEVEEDNDGEVEDEEQPAAINEKDGREDDSLGKETDEEDTEIVPKRTVFRETLLNKKDDDEADDDELKDFREEGVAPNFIVQNVDDEKISKGFVRSIPGKVKGSFRKLFTRSSSSNDDLKNEDESLIEEDSLHSVEPLRLEPIDTHHEEDEVPGEYQSFPTVIITIDNLPTNEEVVSESIDVAVVESVDYNLDFVDEDDDEVEEDNDGEVEDEEQPAAISEDDGKEKESLGKETEEEDTEIVPKRTVFRETLLNKKDDDEADVDELKDFREEGVAPNFIVQNVDDEQISKGFVRSIPGKVKGSFRKLFTRSSSSNDDLKNEDESLIEEDSLHSVEPLRLEPIDTHHEEDEVPGEYQSFPTVTITIDNLPTNEEVVSESIDVAVVESVDYNLDFVDEDDDEVEEDNDGEVEDEEQPAAINEKDGREDDSLGKETDEEDTENGDVSSCLVEKSLIDGSDEISSIQISGKFFIFCKFYDFVF